VKRDADWFEGCEPELVFIAKRLRQAEKLESIFTESGIDYGVEPDHYESGLILRSVKVGAFFYVRPESRERAETVMREYGFVPAK